MPEMRGEERWVAACIEAALPGVTAVQHDDGSRPSLYDLDLVRGDVAFAACEVTAAADAESIELWNLINGSDERWIEDDLSGGWLVAVTPRCQAKRLTKELPGLLREIEKHSAGPMYAAVAERLVALDVASANRGGTDFPGSIYVTLQRDAQRTGGMVATAGNGLVYWFDDWIREPAQKHNLEKLRAAERSEHHLFVLFPGFTTAPFSASDVLMRPDGPLPDVAPNLPMGITDVWFMSMWAAGDLFHFGDGCWSRASKVFEVSTI